MQKRIGLISLIFIPLVLIAMKNIQKDPTTPLIPRTALFGNPEKMDPRISPDGTKIAYLAPLDASDEKSIVNIWVRSTSGNDDYPITEYTDRAPKSFAWSQDGSRILFVKDNQGDENWKLYSVDLTTKEIVCYTPFDKVQVRMVDGKKRADANMLLVELNKDNPALHDVYKLNLKTKELTLLCKNPGGVIAWCVDRNCTDIAAIKDSEKGERCVLSRNTDGSWRTVRQYTFEDSHHNCMPAGYSDAKKAVYMLESKDCDTTRLVSIDTTTGRTTVIAENKNYDMADVAMHSETDEIEAVLCNGEKKEWTVINEQAPIAGILKAFKGKGNVTPLSHDDERRLWTVEVQSDLSTAVYYLYDAKTGTSTELFKARPQLPTQSLCAMEPVTYKSRDGLTIHGYLTCPLNKQRKNLPLILVVHGGPHSRDSWGYNGTVQWLANRDYAVLQINYRGSLGFGKAFVNASSKEWGGKMHDDLIDGVKWATDQGIADPKNVGIFGGSYGGYAALVGAAFTPDTFCCAIDIVGPSNLITLINSFPEYWKVFLEHSYKTIGHPVKEEAFLKSRSPLFKADCIKIPLLIAQGAKDPRVKQAESEQIVEALKKHNIPHQYMLFPDEGHGFSKAENRLKFYAAAEAFLAEHMGGRCEK